MRMEELTTSEEKVLRMIVGGMSNREIAFALDISDNALKTYLRSIFEKLTASDRKEATKIAIERGLVRVKM